ncbi:hypothetical protein ACHAXA_004268 [Cyclostephanos tholiformis]|uniref:Uncharacterized protein n=1 Tax=Cyclostephanos tholiformis TaxID=382380 RepID=A0ABD3RMK6_9STRA
MKTTTLLGLHCRRPPPPRQSLLAELTVGGIVAGSSLVKDRRHPGRKSVVEDDTTGHRLISSFITMTPPDNDSNSNLWSTALDGMIDVPDAIDISSSEGVLYLSPAPPNNPTTSLPAVAVPPWPAIFADGGFAFSLTAHNPMGVSVPHDDNVIANADLERDIVGLANADVSCEVRPRRWWRSFGFHETEGWREDGYTLSYGPENDDERRRDLVRDVVLELAEKYRQAAIYEYAYEDGKLTREVVYVDPKEREARGGIKDVMTIVAAPPRSALSGRYWQRTHNGSY